MQCVFIAKLLRFSLLFFATVVLNIYALGQNQRDIAVKQILDLKNGALLVRLKQNTLKIQALNKHNKTKEANEERQKMDVQNRETILAFKNRYHFGKVYFFYSEHSKEIRDRQFDGIVFDTAMRVTDINASIPFLTSEFGESLQMGLEALIIMDTNFVQLQHPFPFMQKVNTAGVVKRSKFDIVADMNSKLEAFYTRSLEYKPRKKTKK